MGLMDAAAAATTTTFFSHLFVFLVILPFGSVAITGQVQEPFSIKEATVHGLHLAFKNNRLTSRQLVEFYLNRIRKLNPLLRAVIEVNPDALYQADKADQERRANAPGSLSGLHGIPILLKDNIATKDKMNTTAGSYALLGSVVPRDAGVVARLRKSGAIILGKASLSEWSAFRGAAVPNGWCGRSGQGKNPYVLSADPCGSSSGPAISAAAIMAAVTLGTETDGSILCPSSSNSVVGIKPTLGLTSRAGVIPITPTQDTVGPICRTVEDAVYVLDVIAGFDSRDLAATKAASKYIPRGGYKQFLKEDGLRGKGLGIVRNPFFNFSTEPEVGQAFERHLQTLRQRGATVVDHLTMARINEVMDQQESGELVGMLIGFKKAIDAYLKDLVSSPVRSLADLIAYNKKHNKLEMPNNYDQALFLASKEIKLDAEKIVLKNLKSLSMNGFEKLMKEKKLDALVTLRADGHSILAIGGYPGISVPAGYDRNGVPFGICFGGLKGSEPKLIEIAYGFEQATKVRRPPSQEGTAIVDNLEIANIRIILNPGQSGELTIMKAGFKLSINDYLKELITSQVRSLADIIAFIENNPYLEKTEEYGQDMFIAGERTHGFGEKERRAAKLIEQLSLDGIEKMMTGNKLDAMVTLGSGAIALMAIGGYPAITVPPGYD